MLRLRSLPRSMARGTRAAATITPGGVVVVQRPRVDWSEKLMRQLVAREIRGFELEVRFHPTRKWRIDLAHVERKLAVEIEGFGKRGTPGRHQRTVGYLADMEKYNQLAAAGWRLLRFSTRHVKRGEAVELIERIMADVR